MAQVQSQITSPGPWPSMNGWANLEPVGWGQSRMACHPIMKPLAGSESYEQPGPVQKESLDKNKTGRYGHRTWGIIKEINTIIHTTIDTITIEIIGVTIRSWVVRPGADEILFCE